MKKQTGIWILLLATAALVLAAFLAPRLVQPLKYHNFADKRGRLGIPNFGDVASNLPFAIVGIGGFLFLLSEKSKTRFLDQRERLPYFILFFGLILTALGSSYYHWSPDNARLVWDRIPMTIVFMSMVSALIAERINLRAGLSLLPFLIAIGIASVVQWHLSELRGHGDLRFYAAVQVYALLILLVILLLPPRYTRGSDLAIVAAFYVLAKILEASDSQIFSAGHVVSGHTLKHLAAALAGYWILRMLQLRLAIAAAP